MKYQKMDRDVYNIFVFFYVYSIYIFYYFLLVKLKQGYYGKVIVNVFLILKKIFMKFDLQLKICNLLCIQFVNQFFFLMFR